MSGLALEKRPHDVPLMQAVAASNAVDAYLRGRPVPKLIDVCAGVEQQRLTGDARKFGCERGHGA